MCSWRWIAALVAFAAVPLGAQPVLLQIRPRIGDTLSVWMKQRVEMTGSPAECATSLSEPRRGSKSRSNLCSAQPRTMATVTEVFSRAIMRRGGREGTTVLALTDSIRTSSSAGGKPSAPVRVRGRDNVFELRVSTDGGAEVVNENASKELRAMFGQMPATLSRKPVSVGDTWTRQMRLPIAGESGAFGLVKATFELDSLGRNGDIAYISMRGKLTHDHTDGSDSELGGSITGSIQLDRRLAWITETRAVIDVTSIVKQGPGGGLRVRTKITQLTKAGAAR
jgi:hypothetical protein